MDDSTYNKVDNLNMVLIIIVDHNLVAIYWVSDDKAIVVVHVKIVVVIIVYFYYHWDSKNYKLRGSKGMEMVAEIIKVVEDVMVIFIKIIIHYCLYPYVNVVVNNQD